MLDPVSITARCHNLKFIIIVVIDPMYHNSGELILFTQLPDFAILIGLPGDISDRENYDFDQVKSIAKVEVCYLSFRRILYWCLALAFFQFATLLHAAGSDLLE